MGDPATTKGEDNKNISPLLTPLFAKQRGVGGELTLRPKNKMPIRLNRSALIFLWI
jgi:hypothetical protein